MKPLFKISALAAVMVAALTGCNDDDNETKIVAVNPETPASVNTQTYTPITLNLAHINDHHSHLESDATQTFTLDGQTYQAELGGFARVTQLFNDLSNQFAGQNFLKLHAGDAVTGTSYYSFYLGDADADMMNTICFDAFEVGNHEFDDSDAVLKRFIDRLHGGTCQTAVLGANVVPKVGTPLAPNKSDDYIKPYTIKTTKEGVKVGIIGLEVRGKTAGSSRPLSTTEILDETTTAQKYIDVLKKQGIEHIIILSHYGYENDVKLANALTGVDVIIGGDTHTLLGDYKAYDNKANFGSQGPYPTVVKNKDGDTVCVGQAWEYTKAVGVMNVKFNNKGAVDSCTGSSILPIGMTLKKLGSDGKTYETINAADNQALIARLQNNNAALLKQSYLYPVTPNAAAEAILAKYKDQLKDKLTEKIGVAKDTFCLVRVPGTTNSGNVAGCEDSKFLARGSDAAQLVAKSFLDASLRADFALQNAGGVRVALKAGDITYGNANEVLPFSNTLVNLSVTGKEVVATLEDAVENASFGQNGNKASTGAHPYADGLRWDLRLNQNKGNRVQNVEVRDRKTGTWAPIDLNKTYVMVTNDYIASGKDGYLSLAPIFKDPSRVEDIKLLYTQSLVDYIKKQATISLPARSEYSHKSVVTKDGTMLK
ncbi:bifunctional metallophosphatase/5'-nucleotidase [Moraxella atlantae]|uniref:bifunctional metallophosphatase/5'-nucleotidase n=1 Tax=Faucicola atlantae TaxID=34059 RepID=UPI0037510E9D